MNLEEWVYGAYQIDGMKVWENLIAKLRKNGNKGTTSIWVGSNAIMIICIVGLTTKNVYYLAAVLGFVIADEIGKAAGWHD